MKNQKKNKVFYSVVILVVLSLVNILPLFGAPKKSALELFNQGLESESEENWYAASQYYIDVVNINPSYSEA